MCGEKEDILIHLFLNCKIAKTVWNLCYIGIGKVIVLHFEPKQHLRQFNILRLYKVGNRACKCIWITITRQIWKQMNIILFRNTTIDPLEIFKLAQVKTWS